MTEDEHLARHTTLCVDDVATAIAESANWAYRNALSAGGRHTDGFRYFEWCTKPQPGQMVVEVSALRRPAIDRVGVLESVTQEPEVNWDNPDLNGPASMRAVWTIRCLNGRQMRWENCQFIVAPSRRGTFAR